MSRMFLHIYEWLKRHTAIRYILMAGSFLIMLFFALQVKFEEDVTRFFPDTEDARNTEIVFKNLKVKDKIIVMLSANDSTASPVSSDELIRVGDSLKVALEKDISNEYIQQIFSEINGNVIEQVSAFIYDNLPVFLPESDYEGRLDSLFTPEAIDRRMQTNMRYLLLPVSAGIKNIIPYDPLGIGLPALEKLRGFQLTENYSLYNNHIFSKDMSTLLLFLTPRYGTGTTGKNEVLIDSMEEIFASFQNNYPSIRIEYFGGPSVSVYNARQIKKDTTITLSIALVIIILFITVVFRSRSAVLLIILPVLYGAVFSLALIYFLKGTVSGIAIGAGAAIFGVALSYSIHVLSHFNHVTSIRQLIEELAYPMTIGSFTTVGAFLGLLFTTSDILRDFGLFSALTLIGTTFFCLVFLPHFLKVRQSYKTPGKIMSLIEKINGYAYEKNKPLVAGIVILFIVCLFFSGKVTFDSNMMNLGFEPKNIKEAENRLNKLFDSDNRSTLFVSVGQTTEIGLDNYIRTNAKLDSLKAAGKIREYASAGNILIPADIRQERIRRWNTYWTDTRKEEVRQSIIASAGKYGFREDAFDPFFSGILDKQYDAGSFTRSLASLEMMDNWSTETASLSMFITQVRLADSEKETVYSDFSDNKNLVIFDRGYFANKWVSAINDDFDLVLYICSFLVFFALLLSYGRIELTLMTFAPMAISWVIILGIMAVFGIQFNIVNIILATFIFGLGDDFSIFIMDGLQQEYRTGKRLLTSHKTAIFFSSFTAVVGLGVLVFARHPALQSISLISILGMISVVLVSYTILPILFRSFISNPAAKGNYPHTATGLFTTFWFYNGFIVGTSLLIGVASVVILFPVSGRRKKEMISYSMMYMLRGFLRLAWVVKRKTLNPTGEDFRKPAVIVANHQSFIDILIMLSLAPKLVIVTAQWVWNNPLLGRIARYADFVHAGEGYEKLIGHLAKKVEAGYSVVVFPEGTRSRDLEIHRFHKGAFYLAEKLQLDMIPVALYGTGMVLSKREPLRIKNGVMVTKILPRIPYREADLVYQEKARSVKSLIAAAYDELKETESDPQNPHFFQKLITNYIYKGPVEEWYIRIKVKMERNYELFHTLIPRKAAITDIGCGYGMLAYMLNMLAPERRVTGIDYDSDKIALANHNFSKNDSLSFIAGNALTTDLPPSDIFILSDVLHYMDYASQERLIERCIERLLPGGQLIIRDSNASDKEHHRLTRFTEFLSTRLTGFNKKEQELCFPSIAHFQTLADKHQLSLTTHANDRYTSNTIYILQ